MTPDRIDTHARVAVARHRNGRGPPTVTPRPDFFIVGAPKCGTTAMYQYLRQHPSLFLPERKELRFFGSDLDVRDRSPRPLDEFMNFFAAATPEQRVGTAYVWYLYSKTAAAEISRFAPAARIIVMLRRPADMLYALHSEHLSNGNEDLSNFEEALAAEPDRRAGRRIPPHAHLPQGLLYSEVPRYAEQLARYLATFGRDRVHVILFEDFAGDTATSYRETLRFLEVRDDVTPPFDVINPNKRVRSEAARHFLARPPELPRRIIRAAVPARIRRTLYERAQRLNMTTPPRAPLSDATRQHLNDLFRSDVGRLGDLLERDLSHWVEHISHTSRPPEP